MLASHIRTSPCPSSQPNHPPWYLHRPIGHRRPPHPWWNCWIWHWRGCRWAMYHSLCPLAHHPQPPQRCYFFQPRTNKKSVILLKSLSSAKEADFRHYSFKPNKPWFYIVIFSQYYLIQYLTIWHIFIIKQILLLIIIRDNYLSSSLVKNNHNHQGPISDLSHHATNLLDFQSWTIIQTYLYHRDEENNHNENYQKYKSITSTFKDFVIATRSFLSLSDLFESEIWEGSCQQWIWPKLPIC